MSITQSRWINLMVFFFLLVPFLTMAGLNTAPTADAGSDSTEETLSMVLLDGNGSNANDVGQTLTYNWQQISGTPVVLSATDLVQVEFETPKVLPGESPIELVFSLVVNDGIEDSVPDTVTITVEPFTGADPSFNAVVINRFLDPSDSRDTLGDLLFTPDGSQAQLIVGSESSAGKVLIADVVRDANQNVTGFGVWSELFARPNIDTGLTYAPGSDSFLYYVYDEGIGQRTAMGAEEIFTVVNYDIEYGGLAVVPDNYSNAGKIIKAEYEDGRLFIHDLADDGDDTFTISPGVLQSQLPFSDPGDIEYITNGLLADHIVVAAYNNLESTIGLIPVDPVTGLPAATPTIQVLASGNNSAWGLSIDPITGNLWLIGYGDYLLTQYKLDELIFKSGFEPSVTP
ncbi:PKD domain-containing protein [Marinicella sp. W31]|uniref:PKD domain-containing protein n=1 Tax=Marinicella sp. W31 TaxID=3023713 RepID=UPI0037576DC4